MKRLFLILWLLAPGLTLAQDTPKTCVVPSNAVTVRGVRLGQTPRELLAALKLENAPQAAQLRATGRVGFELTGPAAPKLPPAAKEVMAGWAVFSAAFVDDALADFSIVYDTREQWTPEDWAGMIAEKLGLPDKWQTQGRDVYEQAAPGGLLVKVSPRVLGVTYPPCVALQDGRDEQAKRKRRDGFKP